MVSTLTLGGRLSPIQLERRVAVPVEYASSIHSQRSARVRSDSKQ